MPATIINDIKGRELPADWQRKMNVVPDESYSITIRPQREERSLGEIMKDIGREAKARGMTPEILEDILGKPIRHML